jgi:hypothetical protein
MERTAISLTAPVLWLFQWCCCCFWLVGVQERLLFQQLLGEETPEMQGPRRDPSHFPREKVVCPTAKKLLTRHHDWGLRLD